MVLHDGVVVVGGVQVQGVDLVEGVLPTCKHTTGQKQNLSGHRSYRQMSQIQKMLLKLKLRSESENPAT